MDKRKQVTFLVGSGDIREFQAKLEAEQQSGSNEPEDLEFVSPSVPGRKVRMRSSQPETPTPAEPSSPSSTPQT
jgi:hypothetical protein